MQIKHFSDGILQGIVVNPDTGDETSVRFTGPPIDLMKVAAFLQLEPQSSQLDAMLNDEEIDGPVVLTDQKGSYVTLQPVQRASDLLNTIVAEAQKRGLPPPPFI